MDCRKYNLLLAAPLAVLFSVLLGLAYFLEPFDGALTRMGAYLEKDFGWNQPQERLQEKLFILSPDGIYNQYHDIVIFGDSFSTFETLNQWQNYLGKLTGLKSITFSINVDDPVKMIQSPKYLEAPPRIFIYEIAERSMPGKLPVFQGSCRPETAPEVSALAIQPRKVATATFERKKSIDYLNPNFNESSHYLQFLLRRYFAIHISGRFGKLPRALLLPLNKKGLFSSKAQDETLIYHEDLRKHRNSDATFKKMRCGMIHLQNLVQQKGTTLFVALIAPDKATVYDEYLDFQGYRNINLVEYLAQEPGLQMPRLDLALKELVDQGVPDVYLPNDPHWATPGHQRAAQTLVRYLQDRGALLKK